MDGEVDWLKILPHNYFIMSFLYFTCEIHLFLFLNSISLYLLLLNFLLIDDSLLILFLDIDSVIQPSY